MVQQVHAIFENGVLRPLEPLSLSEHQRVVVSVASELPNTAEIVRAQHAAMDELDAKLAKLPDLSLSDGFSAADHDDVLYGSDPT